MPETIGQPKDERSGSTVCSSCPRCSSEIDLDQSGVNGVCWRCGVLWQQSGHKSPRRALLQRDPLKRNQSEELNDALNLIGKYCERNLMDGWTIEIQQDNDEQRIVLTVEFLPGRLRFLKAGQKTIKPNERPTFGCVLCIWNWACGPFESSTANRSNGQSLCRVTIPMPW